MSENQNKEKLSKKIEEMEQLATKKEKEREPTEVASFQLRIYLTVLVFCFYISWCPILFLAGEYYRYIFGPNILLIANLLIDFNIKGLILLLITPVVMILLYLLHLFLVALSTKLIYGLCEWRSPRKEVVGIAGIGKNEAKIVNYYHIRNIPLRLVKWSFGKSPFPQFIKWAFNFVGSNQIHSTAVIEDCFYTHEFLEMQENSFIDRKSIVSSHLVEGKYGAITLKKVVFEKNSGVGAFNLVAPGCYLEENSYVFPNSAILKFQKMKKNKFYDGWPIIRVTKSVYYKFFKIPHEEGEKEEGAE